jgi:hypothetical protein
MAPSASVDVTQLEPPAGHLREIVAMAKAKAVEILIDGGATTAAPGVARGRDAPPAHRRNPCVGKPVPAPGSPHHLADQRWRKPCAGEPVSHLFRWHSNCFCVQA